MQLMMHTLAICARGCSLGDALAVLARLAHCTLKHLHNAVEAVAILLQRIQHHLHEMARTLAPGNTVSARSQARGAGMRGALRGADLSLCLSKKRSVTTPEHGRVRAEESARSACGPTHRE
jgi:hypothetical protein